MQTFKFSKMHGAGNDYIYVNCFKEKVENINETAKAVSAVSYTHLRAHETG